MVIQTAQAQPVHSTGLSNDTDRLHRDNLYMVKRPLMIQNAQGQTLHSRAFHKYANRLYRQCLFITAFADDKDAEDYSLE